MHDEEMYLRIRITDANTEPCDPLEAFFGEIVNVIKEKIRLGYDDPILQLERVHARTLISILITNIMVNLFFTATENTTPSRALLMMNDLLDEIHNMTFKALECADNKFKEENESTSTLHH